LSNLGFDWRISHTDIYSTRVWYANEHPSFCQRSSFNNNDVVKVISRFEFFLLLFACGLVIRLWVIVIYAEFNSASITTPQANVSRKDSNLLITFTTLFLRKRSFKNVQVRPGKLQKMEKIQVEPWKKWTLYNMCHSFLFIGLPWNFWPFVRKFYFYFLRPKTHYTI
jgi:hypothetical protein